MEHGILETALENGDGPKGALQLLLSYAVDAARMIESGDVDVDYHLLVRLYMEQILKATFEAM